MNNELSKIIGERINTLLAEQEKKQKDLAAALEVTDNTISYFCSGKRIPNTFQIKKIAEFFNVSADYLLGLSNAETTDKDIQFICDYTGLSENAIRELKSFQEIQYFNEIVAKLQPYWIGETIFNKFDIINAFIEKGYFKELICIISDYYNAMNYTMNISEYIMEDIERQIESYKNGSVNKVYKYIGEPEEIASNRKEIKLHYYELQELPKEFVRDYCKDRIEKYNDTNKKYDALYSELNYLVEQQEGKQNADNPKT